jgi:hypothetical protein
MQLFSNWDIRQCGTRKQSKVLIDPENEAWGELIACTEGNTSMVLYRTYFGSCRFLDKVGKDTGELCCINHGRIHLEKGRSPHAIHTCHPVHNNRWPLIDTMFAPKDDEIEAIVELQPTISQLSTCGLDRIYVFTAASV